MKRSLALLVILIAVNLCGFIAMYYVYFPWMEKVDNQEQQESILSDIRFLNFRLSLLDYSYSPQTIAKAEHELKAKITATTREQLGMEPANFQTLQENRYGINMARPEGPLAYLLLNDDQTILAVGPYPKHDDSINLRDWFFYLIILLIFNAIAVLIVYRHVNEYLNVAIRAIRELDLTGLRLKPIKSPLTNIAVNTPRVVNHINGLSKQHQQSLYNQRDLMHAVAHEFRGPMARLSFALDLFAQTDSESRQKELSNDMDEALQELDDLVKEVLGYSRLKDGRFPLSLEHFDLKKVCAETIEKVETIYPEKQFVLYSDPAKSIPLYADCNLIERVMINLIRNAARFSNKRVKIALIRFKNSIEIRVEDDGPGFMGAALYPQYTISDDFTLGLRGEYFAEDGNFGAIGSGVADTSVITATLTGSYTVDNLIIKPELRLDSASDDAFIDNDLAATKSLGSFLIAAIYQF